MQDKPRSAAPFSSTTGTTRILVVDDHASMRKLLDRQLCLLGYTTDLAGTAEEGLELWRRRRHRTILTDCELPGMSGYELVQAIRELEKGDAACATTIVVVTGHLEGEAVERCRSNGADECVAKPISLENLSATLHALSVPRYRDLENDGARGI